MRKRSLVTLAALTLSGAAISATAHAAGTPGIPTGLGTYPVPITSTGAQQPCGTGTAYVYPETDGSGALYLQLSATVHAGDDNAPSYNAIFDVTDETAGTALTPLQSAGAAVDGTPVSVQVPVTNGHAYSWTVADTDGALTSGAAGPCDFVADSALPENPTVTSTDFPPTGSNLYTDQDGSFSLSSAELGAVGDDPAGIDGFYYSFDTPVPAVGATFVSADAQGNALLSGQSFGEWGTHTLYVQAVGAGDVVSGQAEYTFFVPQNPGVSPLLQLTHSGGLGVIAAGSSTSGNSVITGCSFDFGDGTAAVTAPGMNCSATHEYAKPGTYTVTFTMSDGAFKASTTQTFVASAPPMPAATSTVFALGPNKSSVQEWGGSANGWVTIGGPASALYAGGAGVFAVNPGGSAIYKYDGTPDHWTEVGGAGAEFTVSNDALYALTSNRSAVERYNGTGTSWSKVGGPAQNICSSVNGVYATSPGNEAVYDYTRASGLWTRVGGAGSSFITSGSTLYGLSPDHTAVLRWNGTGTSWTQIGGAAGRIYAGGLGLFAVNTGNTAVYQFSGTPDSWTKIGGGGYDYAASQTTLYGQSAAGGPVYQYTGTPGSWTNIGGNPTTIVGG